MSDFVQHFHFLRPQWLLMLVPLAALSWFLLRQQARATQWQTLISPHLLPFLVDGKSVKHNKYPVYALLLLWLLATLAAAGPAWQKRPQPVLKQASALVIAWDLSPSMAAQDIKPSRLVRARLKLIDLLKQRTEGLTALIAYSGEAHVVTPLTDDTETIISLLHGLDPGIMPAIGSNAEMALELANKLLAEGASGTGNILFLTDGIDDFAHDEFAQIHDANPHKITIWGIGTSEGAPIPLATGGFAYDRDRNMVIARLNEAELSDLAVEVGGLYVPFSNNDFDIETIKRLSFASDSTSTQQTQRMFDQWYEHGPYLVLLLLPFAALAFRRGLLLSLPLGLVVLSPESHALQWQDLWQTKDQQAQAMLAENPEQAASTFNDPDWRAVAEYQAGNYEQALEGFQGDAAQDYYNRGNALTQLGEYDKAIEQFEKSLQLAPDFDAAQQNLSIAQQLQQLQQQQPQQESDENSQQSDEQNEQESQQQDQSQQGQNQQPQNAQDQNQSAPQNQSSQNQQDPQQSAQQGESSDSSQQSDLTPQQQEALENTYGKNNEDAQQQEQQMAQPEQQEDGEQPDTEQQQSRALAQENTGEQQDNEAQPHNPIVQQRLSPEEQEQQQALDQWLRKVPDDPSGLMRNKFNYEYRARKREMRSNGFRQPDGRQEQERW